MDASKNSGTPKSSNLIGFSIINHPFWGTPIFGNTHINWCRISSINCFDRPNFDLGRVFWPPTSLWLSGWLLWHLPINCKDILNCHKVLLVVTTYYNITQELKCSFTLIPYIYILMHSSSRTIDDLMNCQSLKGIPPKKTERGGGLKPPFWSLI